MQVAGVQGVHRPYLCLSAPLRGVGRSNRLRVLAPRASAAAAIDPSSLSGQSGGQTKPGALSWWRVEAEGRDGKIQKPARQKLSKVLALVGDLISKVRCGSVRV